MAGLNAKRLRPDKDTVMKILHRYIFFILIKNLGLCLTALTVLFLVIDFFDRIDNIVAESPDAGIVLQYFFYKIPVMVGQTLPISMLAATMLTIGMLAKNSEITAMRASGATVLWIARPLVFAGILVSLASMLLNESIIPNSNRRMREIYNIDIMKKDKTGRYSQTDFWWRSGNEFFSVGQFDSRTNTLLEATRLEIDGNLSVTKRTDAEKIEWVDPYLGWSMRNVHEYRFDPQSNIPETLKAKVIPLPIKETPKDFYAAETDPLSMGFFELREFIEKQRRNGLPVSSYLADLNNKISFPFISLIMGITVLPFSLKPARSGSMAGSIMAGLIIGFTYYAVHSFSIAMGRAEIWPPVLAAWMSSIIMGFVALIFNLGAESPS